MLGNVCDLCHPSLYEWDLSAGWVDIPAYRSCLVIITMFDDCVWICYIARGFVPFSVVSRCVCRLVGVFRRCGTSMSMFMCVQCGVLISIQNSPSLSHHSFQPSGKELYIFWF